MTSSIAMLKQQLRNRLGDERMNTLRAVWLLARQDLVDRQRVQVLGPLWLLLQPLAYIILFSTVFSHFMRARLGTDTSQHSYTIYLICGLLLWTAMANTYARLSCVFSSQAGLLRKVPLGLGIFPLHIVVVEAVLYTIAMILFMLFLVIVDHPITLAWLWLPIVVVLALALAYATGFIMGLFEVFASDIRQFTALALQFGFWMTPIVYPISILPASMQPLLAWHPAYWAIGSVHEIVVWHRSPEPLVLLKLTVVSVIMLLLARLLKRRLEREIRDLI